MKNYIVFMVSLFWVGPFLFGQYEHRKKMYVGEGDVFVFENKVVFDCWMKDSSCFPSEYEIKQFLDLHNYAKFEISYHTDSRGTEEANYKYTERMASELCSFLNQRDTKNVLKCIGKGQYHPAQSFFDADSIPHYARSVQRQSIKGSEDFINQFKEKNSELYHLLHQLNRRIELKVIHVDSLKIEEQLLHELRYAAVFDDLESLKNRISFPLNGNDIYLNYCNSIGERECTDYTQKYGNVIIDSAIQSMDDFKILMNEDIYKLLQNGEYENDFGSYSMHIIRACPTDSLPRKLIRITFTFRPKNEKGHYAYSWYYFEVENTYRLERIERRS